MKQAKTDLLKNLQTAFRKALRKIEAAHAGEITIEDPSRRAFLKRSFTGIGALTATRMLSYAQQMPYLSEVSREYSIGILGAGIAGLHAAYILQKAGFNSTVYEAGRRSGGRMFTATDLLGKGITTELGGEFIDSIHTDILNLATEFELPLIDTAQDRNLKKQIFYIGGIMYDADDLVEAFVPYAQQMKEDMDGLPEMITYQDYGNAAQWDNMSIAAYLKLREITGWLYKLLDVAYTTEFGLDIKEQSAINFMVYFNPQTPRELFGESDEQYKIQGGNQRIPDEIVKRLKSVKLGYEATKIKSKGAGFEVSFSNNKIAHFDYLICAIPFTKLRQVELELNGMTAIKKKAINELGYGRNAKMFAGFHTRYWRDGGSGGQVFSDQPFQLGWDSSQLQKGNAGGYTFLTGGMMSDRMKDAPVAKKVTQYISQMHHIFPGAQKNYNGKNGIFHWPSNPLSLGSYSCYKVGQYTTIGGTEKEAIGNMLFAGEHCSYDFQGYMNGGAETGRVAAETLITKLTDH